MQSQIGFVVALLVVIVSLQSTQVAGLQLPEPALPLPNPSPEEVATDNWDDDRPLSNSGRAWHYNRKLVQPLMEVGDAVNDSTLTYVIRTMLAAVVASRTYCPY